MNYKLFINAIIISGIFLTGLAAAQSKPKLQTKTQPQNGLEMTILVTAFPRGEKERETAAKLQPGDFAVLENDRRQRIISVKAATAAPLNLALVVQDNLNWRTNSEIKGLKEFIRELPAGSRVMTAYLTIGGAIVTQELTDNREQAADSLRIIRGGSLPPSFSPFDGVRDVVRHFDDPSKGRQMMLVISDGLDMSRGFASASPYFSISLDRAIRDAQRRGVAVYTIYAPSDERQSYGRFAQNYGQGSLFRLADETGGESYFTGIDFTNFPPYLEEFKETFARQWLITYRSATVGTKFRRIKVTTDFDIHLHHPAGYEPKKGEK